jgi:hypothetical protein
MVNLKKKSIIILLLITNTIIVIADVDTDQSIWFGQNPRDRGNHKYILIISIFIQHLHDAMVMHLEVSFRIVFVRVYSLYVNALIGIVSAHVHTISFMIQSLHDVDQVGLFSNANNGTIHLLFIISRWLNSRANFVDYDPINYFF